MANFCTKCGNALVDGKCPLCTPAVKSVEEGKIEPVLEENEKESQESVLESSVPEKDFDDSETVKEKKVVKKVVRKKVVRKPMNPWQMFLAIIKAPVTSMERVVSDVYMVNGLIFGLIEAVLNAVFLCTLIHSLASMVYNSISSLGNSLTGGYAGYSLGSSYSNYVNIPYFEIFIKSLLLILIMRFIFVLINWGLVVGMGKASVSFKASFPALSGYMTGMIMVLIVAILLCLLSPIVGTIIYVIGSMLALVMYIAGMTGIKGIRKNACVWIAFLTLLLTTLASLLISTVIAGSYIAQLSQMFSAF